MGRPATCATQKDQSIREITIRGVILGAVITLLFTAANVYLGLKVGFGSAEGKEENAKGLRMIVIGFITSAGYALLAAREKPAKKRR